MKMVLRALAVAATLLTTASLWAQSPPKRVALLVGINAYNRRGFVDLKWAENDVDEMGKELARLGFDKVVTLKGSSAGDLRATKENIDAQLRALLRDVTKSDVVLVMLCGHGQQLPVKRADGTESEDGFYCPVDAAMNQPETMVSLSRLTDVTLRTWGGRNLVLVDACRDGVVDPDRGVSRGIQGRVVALPEGTAVLFSCAAGQRSIEREALKHGVFTHSVLEALRGFDGSNGPLTWGSLVDRVQNRVADLNPDQEPISAGAIGRLVLSGRPKAVARPSFEGSRAGEERSDNALGLKLRWCPPGSFRMGSPLNEPERYNSEGPVEVTLSRGFWMGQFEVTQDQWRRVMGTTIGEQRDRYSKGSSLRGEGPSFPIYYVSHNEVTEFCRRLTDSERRAGRLPADWAYRLPTEAQWEYACRAGTTTATAFGDSLGGLDANVDGNYPYNGAEKGPYLEKTCEVGRYRSNGWGLHDMHGNVCEWCDEGYDNRLPGGLDPSGPFEASERVLRGGGWSYRPFRCRSARRGSDPPGLRGESLGFRLALVPSVR